MCTAAQALQSPSVPLALAARCTGSSATAGASPPCAQVCRGSDGAGTGKGQGDGSPLLFHQAKWICRTEDHQAV